MSTELKVTKEAVLAAAAKCETAKATLKVLFPDVFNDSSPINLYRLEGIGDRVLFKEKGTADTSMIAIRDCDSFYLSFNFKWTIEDYGTYQTLTPHKY